MKSGGELGFSSSNDPTDQLRALLGRGHLPANQKVVLHPTLRSATPAIGHLSSTTWKHRRIRLFKSLGSELPADALRNYSHSGLLPIPVLDYRP